MKGKPRVILAGTTALQSPHISHPAMMMVLLRRTTEAPRPGPLGIDLHLGQKPKLGGRYTDVSLIDISFSVGTLYIHISLPFVFVVVLFSTFQNTKRPKKILFFLFICFFSFYYWFALFSSFSYHSKTQKDFTLFACFPSVLVLN